MLDVFAMLISLTLVVALCFIWLPVLDESASGVFRHLVMLAMIVCCATICFQTIMWLTTDLGVFIETYHRVKAENAR